MTSQQRTEPLAAFTPDSRILFQGDSITDGNRGRSADPNHILGHGYAFLIAAKYGAAFPERKLVFLNRGISGKKSRRGWQKNTVRCWCPASASSPMPASVRARTTGSGMASTPPTPATSCSRMLG